MTLADLTAVVHSDLDFIDVVLDRDENADRSFKVQIAVQALLRPYEESLRQKRARGKQRSIIKFFTLSAATSLTYSLMALTGHKSQSLSESPTYSVRAGMVKLD
ncbi:hypothetical protein E2C01_055441 [Portunus trituberculatus]|uniref:Uncharacterized protein n=1 Tax=Portunus trituberculatus TaxID=210409 RepID=A0A5B7GR70_PORTR|nr:hypothetical protein [Portunus trituberculatus]